MPKLKFSMNEIVNDSFTGRSISSIIADNGVRTHLGIDNNVSAFVNGVAVDGNYTVKSTDVVSFQTRSASKA